MQEETKLAELSLDNSGSTVNLEKAFEQHSRSKDILRSFYFSNSNAKRKKKLELTKSR